MENGLVVTTENQSDVLNSLTSLFRFKYEFDVDNIVPGSLIGASERVLKQFL